MLNAIKHREYAYTLLVPCLLSDGETATSGSAQTPPFPKFKPTENAPLKQIANTNLRSGSELQQPTDLSGDLIGSQKELLLNRHSRQAPILNAERRDSRPAFQIKVYVFQTDRSDPAATKETQGTNRTKKCGGRLGDSLKLKIRGPNLVNTGEVGSKARGSSIGWKNKRRESEGTIISTNSRITRLRQLTEAIKVE